MAKVLTLILGLLIVCAHLQGEAGPAADPPVVLLTAYGSFAGRTVNGSETLARRLDGTLIGGAKIVVAVLPVRWGEPEARVPGLVQKLHPLLLLGLGEGYPDVVTCETTGKNAAAGKDEVGADPPAMLEGMGPATRTARITFDPGWFHDTKYPVKSSDDAGTYLCNNMLYIAVSQPVKLVGFVHVPPQGDTPADIYCADLLPIVSTIIAHNVH